MESTTKFRYNAKTVCLTYAQCSLLPVDLKEEVNAKYPLESYLVVRETHRDGNFHLHAWFLFKKKIDTRDVRFLDVQGYHPNILKEYSRIGWVQYLMKTADKDQSG